jgi:UDP-2,3-diacylglucosamine pyrophosphatase LpxH
VIRFVGDLHLGDGARNDLFGHKDTLLAGFARDCEKTCDAVVFVGDTIDLPQAWTPRRVLRAHPGIARAIESLSRKVQVVFIRGNHDWTVDYGQLFPRARVCEALTVGAAHVMHGHQLDRYCRPGRRHHLSKTALHHLVERCFRFSFRVPLRDHDTRQNRLAHWLGGQYGGHLRRMAAVHRRLGRPDRAERCDAFIHYWSRAVWGDPHALFEPAREMIRDGDLSTLVCGHTHLPGAVAVDGGSYVNAGSWTFGAAQFAEWDSERFRVVDHLSGETIGDERYRWMVSGEDPGDFFAWWRLHHQGGLRFDSRAREKTRLCSAEKS